jgi:hypothetical protein
MIVRTVLHKKGGGGGGGGGGCGRLTIAPWKIFGAASFGSTSGRTTAGSLPPSSSVTFFRVAAPVAMIFLPVAAEPVKEICAIFGCSTIIWPSSSPPVIMFITPAGNASTAISESMAVESGV